MDHRATWFNERGKTLTYTGDISFDHNWQYSHLGHGEPQLPPPPAQRLPPAPSRQAPRCGKSPTATRRFTCSGPSTCCRLARNGAAPRSTKQRPVADTLVVETVVDEKHPEATIGELFKLATSDGLPPLSARVPTANKAALETAIAKSGIPVQLLDKMETWAAAFLLLSVQFKDLGLDPASGVETSLKQQFEAGGKPIGQLETNAEQLGFFDRLSEDSQRNFLIAVVEDASSMKGEFDGMLHAWTSGDVKEIAKTFNSDLSDAAELRDALAGPAQCQLGPLGQRPARQAWHGAGRSGCRPPCRRSIGGQPAAERRPQGHTRPIIHRLRAQLVANQVNSSLGLLTVNHFWPTS